MTKAIRIDDVKQPGEALPSATSRPILVSDHTDAPAADPMLASSGSGTDGREESSAPLTHTAKTIVPLTAPTVTSAAHVVPAQKLPADVPAPEPPADADQPGRALSETEPTSGPEPAVETSAATVTPPTSAPTAVGGPTQTSSGDDTADTNETAKSRDPEAAISAEEAAVAEAKVRRQQELEDIVVSGKYTVPVDAVQRRRSRMHIILLCILAVLLLLALLDVAFDMGLVSVPRSVPHTHFFSKG